jgi:type II secretory pathway pseudopilin PulG
MTTRDRSVVIAIVLVAALAAAWLLVVSPERERASKLNAQIATERTQLEAAEGEVAHARTAQAQYAKAYASIVNLGKAVPPTEEVPSLIYELAQASDQKAVDFNSISTNGSGSSTSAAAGVPSSTLTAFTPLPFTFVFEGGFFQLEHLFRQLADFTTLAGGPSQIEVDGRLLTVQSIKLAPSADGSGPGGKPAGTLTGTITATAYVLPASQGLTGGASASAPAAGATPASGAGASSAATPALVKATVP